MDRYQIKRWHFIVLTLIVGLLFSSVALAAPPSWKPPLSTNVSDFQVTPFTGAGTYSIPIEAPKAIGNMAPVISLTYNSQQVDDGGSALSNNQIRIGKGWSINGIPSIQRESLDSNTFYLVFGGSRSKLILGSDGYYHTEDENFAQIKFENNNDGNEANDYWWMKTKDCTYYEFGWSAGSNHYSKKNRDNYCGNYNITYQWDVNYICSKNGDMMGFGYYEARTPSNNQSVTSGGVTCTANTEHEIISGIAYIIYNYHSDGSGPVGGKQFRVDFAAAGTYEYNYGSICTTDPLQCVYWVNYINNYTRYTSIMTKVDGQVLNQYQLNYDSDATSEGMKLASVKTVVGSDTSIPAVTFAYNGNGLLSEVYNGATGGRRQLGYQSYSLNGKTRYRVTSATALDGLGNSYATSYAYSGELWANNEFYGHNYVRTTDAAGNYSEAWYHQDAIKKGRAYEVQSKDPAGNLYTKTSNTYANTTPYTGVNFVYLSQSDHFLYDGDATYKQTRTQYEYDSYGSPVKKSSLGDVSISGDEVYEYTEYMNNTTGWLLGVPHHQYTKKSDDATLVAESWYYYSGTYNGEVTYNNWMNYLRKVETAAVFGSRGNAANPTVETDYDEWGNATTVRDALGHATTTTYDSVFHIFPVSSANALGHTSYTYYYGVNAEGDSGFTGSGLWGQIKSSKDINGRYNRTKYDTLGRVTAAWNENFAEDSPGIGYEYAFYQDATHPAKVVTKKKDQPYTYVICSDPGGCHTYPSNTFYTYTYSDGLGRIVQIQTPTEEEGKMYVSGPVDYNNRGLAWKKYVGYKAVSTGAYIASPIKEKATTYTYDAVGRVTRTDNPDGTFTRSFYNDYVSTAVDANNKQVRNTVDAYGRAVMTETFTGNYPTETVYSTTTYEYDALGRQTEVTDAQGNINTVTYDNMGRKVATQDMDMGNWSYSYDKNGNLTSQTDAKGQTIIMEYDALGRLTKKTNPDGTFVRNIYDSLAGYDGENPLGKLLKTEEGSE